LRQSIETPSPRRDGALCGVAFKVTSQAAVAADPRKSSLDDPAFGQDFEAIVGFRRSHPLRELRLRESSSPTPPHIPPHPEWLALPTKPVRLSIQHRVQRLLAVAVPDPADVDIYPCGTVQPFNLALVLKPGCRDPLAKSAGGRLVSGFTIAQSAYSHEDPPKSVQDYLDTLRTQGLLATVKAIEPFDQFI
jgi:hypothetical protein